VKLYRNSNSLLGITPRVKECSVREKDFAPPEWGGVAKLTEGKPKPGEKGDAWEKNSAFLRGGPIGKGETSHK